MYMTNTACGAEITQIVDALPYEELIRTEDVAGQLANRLSIPYDKARAARSEERRVGKECGS